MHIGVRMTVYIEKVACASPAKVICFDMNEKSPNRSIQENGAAGLLTLLHSGKLCVIQGTSDGTILGIFVKKNVPLEESASFPAVARK